MNGQKPARKTPARQGRDAALAALGLLFTLLGLLGALLPLLPTTPFLLLAAWCFAESSPRLHRWLHENRLFGEYLRRYRSDEGLPLSTKVGTISLLWLTLAVSAYALSDRGPWSAVLLAVVGISVTVHISRIKTSAK
ncbi:MAG: YbaN family protein [Elusimicrobiales bacterium]|nr:YbaN family protein [Elusimicrobiales bacterium]